MKKDSMKTGAILTLFVMGIALLFFACEKKANPVASSSSDDSAFAIYFLADTQLKMEDVSEKNIDELELAPLPWLCDNDIEFYDWSSHCIYLKKDKSYFLPNWNNDSFTQFPVDWNNKPFIVTAYDEKCYLGFFAGALSNFGIAPEIRDSYSNFYPANILNLYWAWLYHDFPQDHPEVQRALIESGLYHGGISVLFDTTDANTLCMVENADTSTISYKFRITNEDEDNLYILDPDKMGTEFFHWFTNGLVFQHVETRKLYESRWKKLAELPSLDYWSPNWFTKLSSGDTITRTVVLKGYPHLPPGEYLFEFKYGIIHPGMEKDDLELADGRYWIGKTRSNILVWNYDGTESGFPGNSKILQKQSYFDYDFLKSAPIEAYSNIERR